MPRNAYGVVCGTPARPASGEASNLTRTGAVEAFPNTEAWCKHVGKVYHEYHGYRECIARGQT